MSGQWGAAQLREDTLYELTPASLVSQFVDSFSPSTVVTLPPTQLGKFFVFTNTGSADFEVQSSVGIPILTIAPGECFLVHSDGLTWRTLGGGGGGTPIGVFTETDDGLVPAPGAPGPDLRYLDEEGNWTVPSTGGGGGLTNAFATITDGTNNAVASGADTFRLRSSSGKITIAVTNNEAVFGDNANLSVNEAAVDHDALLNFVADEHVAHTSVTFTVGAGLTGGGDISASRSINLDFPGLTAIGAAVAANDVVPLYDTSANAHRKATVGDLAPAIDHDSLAGFVANEHIDHSTVSINTGTGLTGGGNITANRTISLDFNALPTQAESMASGDAFPFWDLSGSVHKKITFANLNAAWDHNALANYVADQHVAHSGVTLTAGAGLTGGGTIAASRTFDVGAGTGITVNADDVAVTFASTTEVLTGTSAVKSASPDAIAALWEKGSNVASAATVSLGEGGFFHITGTTTITDIDWATAKDGRTAFVVFDGALTLTHNATTLVLPGGANIVTAAGDKAIFVQDNADNVICLSYVRASGLALIGLTDGDKGDITVGSGVTTLTVDNDVVTFAKMQNIATDRLIGRDTASSGDPEEVSVTNGLEFTGGPGIGMSANQRTVGLVYIIDGGGATITTGNKRGFRVPFACTITNWSIGLDQSGSIVIDIWKDTQANYPPVVGDSITASAKPTVTTATNATSGTLTGWTTSVAAGDYLFFNVDSVTSAQWASIMLQVTKT